MYFARPSSHRSLAWVVLKPNSVGCNKPVQHASYDFRIVLLVRKHGLWRLSMYFIAFNASKPFHFDFLFSATFSLDESFNGVVMFYVAPARRT